MPVSPELRERLLARHAAGEFTTPPPAPTNYRPPTRHQRMVEAYRDARSAWENQREEVAIGYKSEMADFQRDNPSPMLRDFMRDFV